MNFKRFCRSTLFDKTSALFTAVIVIHNLLQIILIYSNIELRGYPFTVVLHVCTSSSRFWRTAVTVFCSSLTLLERKTYESFAATFYLIKGKKSSSALFCVLAPSLPRSLDPAQTGISLDILFIVTGNPPGIHWESPTIKEKCNIMQGHIPRTLVMQ